MKASEVYLKAAEGVDDQRRWGSCDWINQIVKGTPFEDDCDEQKVFEKLFKPSVEQRIGITHKNPYWGDAWGEERYDCRVLALLFMHHIAADEERK